MRLQGFGADLLSRSATGGYSQKQLTDLAGNMFCGSIVAATLIAAIACIPHADAFALSRARRACTKSLPVQVEPAPAASASTADAAAVTEVVASDSESDDLGFA